jgi:hypothetical protein
MRYLAVVAVVIGIALWLTAPPTTKDRVQAWTTSTFFGAVHDAAHNACPHPYMDSTGRQSCDGPPRPSSTR